MPMGVPKTPSRATRYNKYLRKEYAPLSLGRLNMAKLPINLAREQHAITVERQESILHLVERLETVVHATPMVGWPLYPLHQVT